MWEHRAGRIDFEGPLLQLLQRGWGFREYAPIVAGRDGGCWAVVGLRGEVRIRADCTERKEAWAEAVRLALTAAGEAGPPRKIPVCGMMDASPADPTASAEECARLRQAGWAFSEHATTGASGREGWVVSGARGGRTIRVQDDDRAAAWGAALILAAVTGAGASGGPPEPTLPDRVG